MSPIHAKFCPECGTRRTGSANFCGHCGYRFVPPAVQQGDPPISRGGMPTPPSVVPAPSVRDEPMTAGRPQPTVPTSTKSPVSTQPVAPAVAGAPAPPPSAVPVLPIGWHTVGDGSQRYWNGEEWTHAIVNGRVIGVPTGPPTSAPQSAAPELTYGPEYVAGVDCPNCGFALGTGGSCPACGERA